MQFDFSVLVLGMPSSSFVLLFIWALLFPSPSNGLLPPSFSNGSLLCSSPPAGTSVLEGSVVIFSRPPLKALGRRSYLGEFNTNMNLTCITQGLPHDWKAPPKSLKSISFYSSEEIYAFVEALHHVYYNRSTTFEEVHDLHLSTLSISKLKNDNVGFYECLPQSPLANTKKNSFYLTVKDDRRPYALPSMLTYTSAEEGSNAYIPCRPSHPGILVRLERGENPGVALNQHPFNFKRGFLLRNISLLQDEGLYRCVFTSSRVRDVYRDVRLSILPREVNATISLADPYLVPHIGLCICGLFFSKLP